MRFNDHHRSTLAISDQIRACKQENGLVYLHFYKEFLERSTERSGFHDAFFLATSLPRKCSMYLYRTY